MFKLTKDGILLPREFDTRADAERTMATLNKLTRWAYSYRVVSL